MIWLALTAAMAQEGPTITPPQFNPSVYRASIDSRRGLLLDDATVAPNSTLHARLGFNYSNGLMGAVRVGGAEDGELYRVITHALAADLSIGITGGPLRIGLHAPVWLNIGSDFEGLAGQGIGDLGLDLKLTALDPADKPVGVAFAGRVVAPTGTVAAPLIDDGLAWEAQLILDKRAGPASAVLNLGTRGAPAVSSANLSLAGAAFARVGFAYDLSDTSGLFVDLSGRVSYTQARQDQDGPNTDLLSALPAEGMLGGWSRLSGPLVVRGGIGTGLTAAVGSPVVRGLLVLSYEPVGALDLDGDGLVGKADACPNAPEDPDGFEDSDGCPDLDNDGDGVVDADDACPLEPEDLDDWQDDDGCADPLTNVHVRVTDPAGRVIVGVNTRIGEGSDTLGGNADFTLDLAPGEYALTAEAEGYDNLSSSLSVLAGPAMSASFVLSPQEVAGIVTVKVVNESFKPIKNASVTVGDEVLPLAEGLGEIVLMAGKYSLTAAAPGHKPGDFPFEVAAGENTTLFVPLTASLGTLNLTVSDPAGEPIADAYWAAADGAILPLTGGAASSELLEGPYDVSIIAEGFMPTTVPTKVRGGETTELNVVLTPKRVTVSQDRIEIADRVYFDTGRSTIAAASHTLLDEVAQILNANPQISRVRIEGHTDSRGSESSNLALSEARAQAVRSYLIQAGVDQARLEARGFGESQPIAEGSNEDAWSKNRRVDFFIVARDED